MHHGTAQSVEKKLSSEVMLRNLPNNYTRTMLLAMLDSEGFEGKCLGSRGSDLNLLNLLNHLRFF